MKRTSFETASGGVVHNIVTDNARVGLQAGDVYLAPGSTLDFSSFFKEDKEPTDEGNETFDDRLAETDPLLAASRDIGNEAAKLTGVRVVGSERPENAVGTPDNYSYTDDDGGVHNVITGGSTLFQGMNFAPGSTINGIPASEYFSVSPEEDVAESDETTETDPHEESQNEQVPEKRENSAPDVEETAQEEPALPLDDAEQIPPQSTTVSPRVSVTYSSPRTSYDSRLSFGGTAAQESQVAEKYTEQLERDRIDLYLLNLLDYFRTHLQERERSGEDSERTKRILEIVDRLIALLKEPQNEQSLEEKSDQ